MNDLLFLVIQQLYMQVVACNCIFVYQLTEDLSWGSYKLAQQTDCMCAVTVTAGFELLHTATIIISVLVKTVLHVVWHWTTFTAPKNWGHCYLTQCRWALNKSHLHYFREHAFNACMHFRLIQATYLHASMAISISHAYNWLRVQLIIIVRVTSNGKASNSPHAFTLPVLVMSAINLLLHS